jgi:hypothetical protein
LPNAGIAFITERVREELAGVAQLVGVCSLAAGADQLFARLVLEEGGKISVVVPCRHYETTFKRATDRRAFHALLRRAARVEQLEFEEPSEEAYFAAGRRVVDQSERLIAVWDGQRARGLGGTADVVRYARGCGHEVVVIWPDGLAR